MTDVAKETTMTMTDAGREAIKKLLCCLLKAYSSSIRSTFGLAGESPRAAEIRDRLNRGLHAAVDEL
ncbi:MAG: hypothetical protein MJA29_09190, partial [Candidatus Omnitrophica bacterium]|nr:hypothetical protein [Candidatus Omnitrophota bacterium]